jgi:hypothetical protein
MAVNLVVVLENDNPVVNSEIFLFMRFDIRAGLSPGKNMPRHRTSEHMRRMPCSIVDGFAVSGFLSALTIFGCTAVLFISYIPLILYNDKAGITYHKGNGNKEPGVQPLLRGRTFPVTSVVLLFPCLQEDSK